MPKKVCSFCGRDESQVKLLITGLNGYICEDCAVQAYKIVKDTGVLGNVDEEASEKSKEAFRKKTRIPKPQDIKK